MKKTIPARIVSIFIAVFMMMQLSVCVQAAQGSDATAGSLSEAEMSALGLTAGYISEVAVSGGNSSAAARQELTSRGYTVIDKDLNAGSGGRPLYLHCDGIERKSLFTRPSNVSGASWMQNLPDGLSIANINIHGTHDSATYRTSCFFAIEAFTEVQDHPSGSHGI